MTIESNALKRFRLRWVGRSIKFHPTIMGATSDDILEGIVDGVGDDGHKLGYDARRRVKPTEMLFVKLPDGRIVDVHISTVKATSSKFATKQAGAVDGREG
jgi:hypothetical protein